MSLIYPLYISFYAQDEVLIKVQADHMLLNCNVSGGMFIIEQSIDAPSGCR